MRTLFGVCFIIIACVLLVGCGGGPKTMQATATGEIPQWYVNPPQDPNYLYAAYTESSQDVQVALDKALLGARTELGRQVEVKIAALQKKFVEETGTGQDAQILQQFSEASKNVVSTTLTGSAMKKQERVKDGNMWRAYVLAAYPIGDANKAMLDAIKKNQEMYTRFRASQAFQELDTEVQKYEDSKKQQAPK